MASSLTSTEEQATKKFLEELNQKAEQSCTSPVPWNIAIRFLMARKFDIKRAHELYESHQNTRKREEINIIDPFEEAVRVELLLEKFTVLPSRDESGAAIALFTARKHRPEISTHGAVLKGLMFQLDTALESIDTQRNGLVFIYDMTGSKYNHFDYELSIKILSMLKGSYPARLKKVLIVTAPLWFRAPFKILRLFVREKLRDRVHTVGIDNLANHIPRDSLPVSLGGSLSVNHKAWLATCLHSWTSTHNSTITDSNNGINANTIQDIDAFFRDFELPPEETSMSDSMISSLGDNSSPGLNGGDHFDYSDSDKSPTKSELSTGRSGDGRQTTPKRPHREDMESSNESLQNQPSKKAHSDSQYADDYSIHMPEEGGYTIEEFVSYIQHKGQDGLVQEYKEMKSQPASGTFTVSRTPYNLQKNRYTDVMCLDQTRVQLSIQHGDPTSDYINANLVDGYRQKNAFISTQGPLPRTFPDFWRMIWEQQSQIIVMTTRTIERGRTKCGQYWPLPESPAEQYGEFVVINNDIDRRTDYNITSLILQNIQTQEAREITHFQFTSWPDYGVPHCAGAFLDIMLHVRDHQANRVKSMTPPWNGHPLGPPIVVHCSAGIGRTGTFITMDTCTKRLADIGTINIHQTVKRIRSQRAFSIQMPEQYVFCHLALIEHAQRNGLLPEDLDLEGFDDSDSDSA